MVGKKLDKLQCLSLDKQPKESKEGDPAKLKRKKKETLKFAPVPISKSKMYLLRSKAPNYYPLWDRDLKRLKDQTNSSYEYQLCKMGFCYGLNVNEVMRLIQMWWSHHHIQGKVDRLLTRDNSECPGEVEILYREVRSETGRKETRET